MGFYCHTTVPEALSPDSKKKSHCMEKPEHHKWRLAPILCN